jgi:hypothetical protein
MKFACYARATGLKMIGLPRGGGEVSERLNENVAASDSRRPLGVVAAGAKIDGKHVQERVGRALLKSSLAVLVFGRLELPILRETLLSSIFFR